MSFTESLKQALESLRSNKLRSFLTMLGIIMGVFSVITIVAIGNAAEAYMKGQFERLGANIIQVREKGKNADPKDWIVLEDMDTIKRATPDIKNIVAYIQQMGEIKVGSKTRDAVVIGVTPQYKSFTPMEMAAGRFVGDMDVTNRAGLAIVDENFAQKYYKRNDIVGEDLLLRAGNGTVQKLKIVGVTKSDGNIFANMFGDDFPVTVIMPVTTVQNIYGIKKVDGIEVSIEGTDDKLKATGSRIVKALEFKHGNKDKYMATNSADMQQSLSSVLGVISGVLLVIAVITLIVGGIGIVNILLVSVTERIREIGIRKALGAQKKDIVLQFLTESIIMTGIGGLIGIVLGIGAATVISLLIKIPPTVNMFTVVFAFTGSVALGIVFGVYPAKKAADLDPIESLRYE